jgi:hypothetical protein
MYKINQDFTVKAQEELNDVFSAGKYLVPQGAGDCPRNPCLLSCTS